jgi:hypothetical protein
MKKKIIITLGTVLASGAILASAHGVAGKNITPADLSQKFTNEAKVLGISVDEVKNGWANGKNIFDLAKEKGIATSTLEAKMKELREAEMKIKLQELVTAGVMTQAQADLRIQTMKNNVEKRFDRKMQKHEKKQEKRLQQI